MEKLKSPELSYTKMIYLETSSRFFLVCLTSQLTHEFTVCISRDLLQLLRLKCMHNQVGRYVSCDAVIINDTQEKS